MTHTASLQTTAQAQGADSARGLAAMLLAVVVAIVGVLAEPLLGHWSDGQLFAGWLGLWLLAFAGTLALTGGAMRLNPWDKLEPAEASA